MLQIQLNAFGLLTSYRSGANRYDYLEPFDAMWNAFHSAYFARISAHKQQNVQPIFENRAFTFIPYRMIPKPLSKYTLNSHQLHEHNGDGSTFRFSAIVKHHRWTIQFHIHESIERTRIYAQILSVYFVLIVKVVMSWKYHKKKKTWCSYVCI